LYCRKNCICYEMMRNAPKRTVPRYQKGSHSNKLESVFMTFWTVFCNYNCSILFLYIIFFNLSDVQCSYGIVRKMKKSVSKVQCKCHPTLSFRHYNKNPPALNFYKGSIFTLPNYLLNRITKRQLTLQEIQNLL